MPRNARAAAAAAAGAASTPSTAALEGRVAALTAELHDSEQRYERIIAAVAEGIYEWDIETNALSPSARLIEIFGFHGRDLGAGDWNVLVHPDDFPRYRAALRDCFRGVTPQLDCEYRIRHSDGAYRWIEDRAVPVRNAVGRAVRLTGAITDISERKAAEQGLRESLEYQTAISNVLKVISRSVIDLDAVLDAVVTSAVRLCRADQAVIYRNEGGEYRWAAGHSLSPDYERIERNVTIVPGAGTLVGRAALEGRAVQIDDAWTDPLYEAKDDARVGGVRSMLGVPLLRDGAVIGVIGLARRRVEPYSEREMELVTTFADQAVIAIENTRLITETREALEQQTATAEVLRVISSSPDDVQPTFDAIVASAARLCEAEFSAVARFEDGLLHLVATNNLSPEEGAAFHSLFPRPPLRNFVMGRAFADAEPAQFADVLAEADYDARTRQVLQAALGYRTFMAVPIFRSGIPIGVIGCARRQVKPFSAAQIQLLNTFAEQASIALDNVRLFTELRERTHDLEESLEYQTETGDVLNVISRSPAQLQLVFDTITDTAQRLCQSEHVFIMRLEEDGRYHLAAAKGASADQIEFLRRTPFAADRGSVTGRVATERRTIHVPDVLADPDYTMNVRGHQGYRTTLGVPLLSDGAVGGVIVLTRAEAQPFTERQIELVRTFADQAVIAIENARLLTELREALEQQTATAEVLQVINSSPGDLEPVFNAMLEKAMQLCEGAFGGLWTFDGDRFVSVALRGVPPAYREFLRTATMIPGPGSAPDRFRRGERSVMQNTDLKAEELYRIGDPQRRALVDLGGARTAMHVPLCREDAVLGVIAIYRQEVRPFSEKQIALLQNFAAQAVIAMDNARLLDETRQRQIELRVTFDNMGDGVAMFDAEMRLAAWNMNFQKILDLPDDFVAARPSYADYSRYLARRGEFGAADIEAEVARMARVVGTQGSLERARPDGRVIEVRYNSVPGGGFVLIYGDITERKRAEAEISAARDAAEAALGELKTAQASLIHAEKMASLGQLTAGIAHEIKNPLNFVNNFAGLSVELLDELKEMAEPGIATLEHDTRAEIDETIGMLTSNMEKIAEHGSRADGIVKSMLAHSRGTSGERQTVELNALVEEALNLAYHGARAQDPGFNITLERDYAAALAPVDVVPQDITRVFLNLIGNGFYAANKRRERTADPAFRPILKVTTRELGRTVEIAVRDNGVGIAPELRHKLFQPFFTTKPTGEGTGLGLSISYDIITQEHGGTIAVDSRAGEFTEFTVRLPRAPHGRPRAARSPC